MNQQPLVTTGHSPKTTRHRDIEIRPVVIGKLPMTVEWFHRGERIYSDARTLYTQYTASVSTARYGVYTLRVKNGAEELETKDVLFTPNAHQGRLVLVITWLCS